MKKLIFVAAMAAMALSSCSKNEVDSGSTTTQSNDAIGFSTFVGINTKGLVTNSSTTASSTTTTIESTGFGVFGYYHPYTQADTSTAGKFVDSGTGISSADFMYNQEIEYGQYDGSNSGWFYSPVKYWPNNTLDRLSFFAYAPYSATGVDIKSTGTPSLTFTINNTPETMVDLVADMKYNIAKSSTDALTSTPSTVSFELQHILSRADIAVCLGDDITVTDDLQDSDGSGSATTQTAVYLTDLKLVGTADTSSPLYDATGAALKSTGLRSTGVFKATASTSKVSATDVTNNKYGDSGVTEGDYVVDYVLGAWDYTDSNGAVLQKDNYDLWSMVSETYNTTETFIGTTGPSGTVTGYGTNNKFRVPQPISGQTGSSSYTRVFKDNHYLFLVPQQSTETTYLYVQYDVVTVDSKLTLGYSKVTNYAIVELSGLTTIGVAYRYNITIGLSSVKVSADVDEGWKTSTEEFADIEVVTVTGGTTITATDVTGLASALTELNALAETSTDTTFNVNASTVELSASQTIDLTDCKFEDGDTIVFTFSSITNSASITITGATGLTFTPTTDGNKISIAVANV